MKSIKIILTAIAIVIVTAILSSSVYAGTVNTINATENGGKITVSGTVDSSVYAVAVVVYSGSDLVYMQTGNVNSDGSYSIELEKDFTNGVYEVRVADYNGGEYKTTSVEIKENEQSNQEIKTTTENTIENTTQEKSNNPKTGDYIMIALAIFGLGTIGTVVTTKLNKKSKVSKH